LGKDETGRTLNGKVILKIGKFTNRERQRGRLIFAKWVASGIHLSKISLEVLTRFFRQKISTNYADYSNARTNKSASNTLPHLGGVRKMTFYYHSRPGTLQNDSGLWIQWIQGRRSSGFRGFRE
jgi:hypothetical protein